MSSSWQQERIWDIAEFTTIHRNISLIQNDLRLRQQATTELSHHGLPPVMRTVRSGRPGKPKYIIDENFLRFAYQHRTISSIANFLGVHRSTVRQALLSYGIAQPLENPFASENEGTTQTISSYTRPLSTLSDNDLDEHLRQIRRQEGFTRAGVTVLHGMLLSRGHRLPRERIRRSLLRIDPENRIFRAPPVQRRRYVVPGPNSVWHHDGQHGASFNFCILFKQITHAIISDRANTIWNCHTWLCRWIFAPHYRPQSVR